MTKPEGLGRKISGTEQPTSAVPVDGSGPAPGCASWTLYRNAQILNSSLGHKVEAKKDLPPPAQLPPELELNKEFITKWLMTPKEEKMNYGRIRTAPVWKTYVRDAGMRLTVILELTHIGRRT